MSKRSLDAERAFLEKQLSEAKMLIEYPDLKNAKMIPRLVEDPRRFFDAVQKPLGTRHVSISTSRTVRPITLNAGEFMLEAIRDELYLKQYRDEREHSEWIDLGGES